MPRITLTHLTFIGRNKPPASVTFGPHLTVIRGASDTGKSFVVNAIDFMLGGSSLKAIPERDGYNTVLLGLRWGDFEVTLVRSTSGGNLSLYNGHHTDLPSRPADEQLLGQMNRRSSTRSVSSLLLEATDLTNRLVRRNRYNEVSALSFRDLAHLCVISEDRMLSETPAGYTGQVVNQTKETSVLKMLLQNDDDSSLVGQETAEAQSRAVAAKVELLESMIDQCDAALQDLPEEQELKNQLTRLTHTLEAQAALVQDRVGSRNAIVDSVRQVVDEMTQARQRLSEVVSLEARLGLLNSQYESDLARLAMVAEAGNLLGYFRPGPCVFCGAAPEHQHVESPCPGETTAFHASIQSETDKTRELRNDLRATLQDLQSEALRLRDQISVLESRRETLDEQLAESEATLRPDADSLNSLVLQRSEIDRVLGLHAQRADLIKRKNLMQDQAGGPVSTADTAMTLSVEREFSEELVRLLTVWDYPHATTTRYDRDEGEIISGDQPRAAHGKGVRGILHAAFTLGIMQYCLSRDLPHPGFVVLDSPLVTYRAPGTPIRDDDEETVSVDVVRAFYRDIQGAEAGQIIVMENTDPPDPLDPETEDIVFTGVLGFGRYGFFPPLGSPPSADHALVALLQDTLALTDGAEEPA